MVFLRKNLRAISEFKTVVHRKLMNPIKLFFQTLFKNPKTETKMAVDSIYDIKIKSLQDQALDLSQYKGKYILFVNVASKCGFTPQYKELQELYNAHKEHLVVIGVPCNQFGSQEPGSSESIAEFCEVNYGVSFPITEKIDVKGSQQHPLYQWLTQKINNGQKDTSVKWNFQKYLIDPKGHYVDYYLSTTSPISSKITKYFKN